MAEAAPVQGRVLELGCGAGAYSRRLVAAGAEAVVAVDRSAAMLRAASAPGVEPLNADAALLSLPERFGLVVSAGMLEFVPDPGAVLRVVRAHLTPDGRAVLLVPRDGWLGDRYRAWHGSHGVPVRLFSRASLTAAADAAGLRVERAREVAPFALVARLRAREVGCAS